jgi:hypothetical protein
MLRAISTVLQPQHPRFAEIFRGMDSCIGCHVVLCILPLATAVGSTKRPVEFFVSANQPRVFVCNSVSKLVPQDVTQASMREHARTQNEPGDVDVATSKPEQAVERAGSVSKEPIGRWE